MVDAEASFELIATETFELRAGEASNARAFLAESVRLDSMRTAEVALLVTELIANAIQHGQADSVKVSVWQRDRVIRVVVSHQSLTPIGEFTPGLGFRLLESFSRSWGLEEQDDNLTVWFESRAPGSISVVPAGMDEPALISQVGTDASYAEELVERYKPLALAIASRYKNKGISDEDVDQVAVIALFKAIHRFDPELGSLKSFAAVTISGELKRQVRDRGWSVRVPRALQELTLVVTRTAHDLTQSSGRTPTIGEIAEAIEDASIEDVAEALEVAQSYRAASLDEPETEGGTTLIDVLGDVDAGIGEAALRTDIEEALTELAPRERLIIELRFYEDMTQSEIAEVVGVSQMQVSRLLSRSLAKLGELLEG